MSRLACKCSPQRVRRSVRQLHMNAAQARALSAHASRWPSVLQSLRAAHDRSSRCALGLVLVPPQAPSAVGEVHLQSLSDAASAGILEPLDLKLQLVDGVLGCLAQLLLIDDVLPVRRGRLQAAARRGGLLETMSASARQRRRSRDPESESENEEAGKVEDEDSCED
jgi:hypothetical protein